VPHIVGCIKWVPDTTQVRIDPETNTLIREGVPSIINPFDVHGIEEAVRLKERFGGKVTMICMGPPFASEGLKKAVALGADQGILLSDRALAGSDTLATSAALAAAIRRLDREEPVDLVICGKQTIDGDTAQVGPGIATRLGFSQLTYVSEVQNIDAAARTIRVRRNLEGAHEIVEAPLPALITVLPDINEARYASLPSLIRGLKYEVPKWTAADMEVDLGEVGLAGSPTQVRRIFSPPERVGGEVMWRDSSDAEGIAKALAGMLIDAGVFGTGEREEE
jgi:electron transfer flavoprotein beta subunit